MQNLRTKNWRCFLDKFSNRDIQKITGMSARQICYMTEKGFISPEIEDVSGRGRTRWYSRRNVIQFLVLKIMKNSLGSFPGLEVASTILHVLKDDIDYTLDDKLEKGLTVLHIINGRNAFLSTKDGKSNSSPFHITSAKKYEKLTKTAPQIIEDGKVHLVIDLEKIINSKKFM